ncbi:hypothetical protein COLO4_38591 [Corchorus olitorius]|uniref:Uncharacterized protein n=1 Tax=Corchorus olitorius TaxID=93759 RepID=A0A1R3FU12_9ROSI|nr:hypothetical protein COLO4_38591 [Corchorus olitorius]
MATSFHTCAQEAQPAKRGNRDEMKFGKRKGMGGAA